MMQELNKAVVKQSEAWGGKFVKGRKASLQRQRASASGELISDMDYEVVTEDGAVTTNISFPDQGRFIDMKPGNISHDRWGRDAIDRLGKWVQKRGLQNFAKGYLKHRKLNTLPVNETTMINNIAWAIAIARTDGKFKRKAWYAKASAGAVNDLYNQVAGAITDTAADNISESIKP